MRFAAALALAASAASLAAAQTTTNAPPAQTASGCDAQKYGPLSFFHTIHIPPWLRSTTRQC